MKILQQTLDSFLHGKYELPFSESNKQAFIGHFVGGVFTSFPNPDDLRNIYGSNARWWKTGRGMFFSGENVHCTKDFKLISIPVGTRIIAYCTESPHGRFNILGVGDYETVHPVLFMPWKDLLVHASSLSLQEFLDTSKDESLSVDLQHFLGVERCVVFDEENGSFVVGRKNEEGYFSISGSVFSMTLEEFNRILTKNEVILSEITCVDSSGELKQFKLILPLNVTNPQAASINLNQFVKDAKRLAEVAAVYRDAAAFSEEFSVPEEIRLKTYLFVRAFFNNWQSQNSWPAETSIKLKPYFAKRLTYSDIKMICSSTCNLFLRKEMDNGFQYQLTGAVYQYAKDHQWPKDWKERDFYPEDIEVLWPKSDQEQPDQEQPDQEQSDQEQSDQEQPDQEQSDQEQSDQEQPDQEQPDQEQPDQEQLDAEQHTSPHKFSSRPEEDPERKAIIDFKVALDTAGWRYSLRDIIRFHTSVRCEPLTILGGAPGSGKSSLARLYAEYFGLGEENQFLQIDVQPSWHDRMDFLGFIKTHGDATVFEDAETGMASFLRGTTGTTGLRLACLEEINLARPEHYFADFLQRISLDDDKREGTPIKFWSRDGKPIESFQLSKYVRFVGTCNFDETTQNFSARFLDRCNYIEFSPRPLRELFSSPEPKDTTEQSAWDWTPYSTADSSELVLKQCKEAVWGLLQQLTEFKKTNSPYEETSNESSDDEPRNLLKDLGLIPSARAIQGILRYVCARVSTAGDILDWKGKDIPEEEKRRLQTDLLDRAVDEAIVQRLLPKMLSSQAAFPGTDVENIENSLLSAIGDKYPLSRGFIACHRSTFR